MHTTSNDGIAGIHASGLTSAVVVTGGGSSAVHRLLSCPGASRTVAHVEIPYGPEALSRCLGGVPDQAVSGETARRLASVAFTRAGRAGRGTGPIAGIACTAALATDRHRRGEEQAFLAGRTAYREVCVHVRFEKGKATREEQEEMLGGLILDLMAGVAGIPGFGDATCDGVALERSVTSRRTLLDELGEGNREVVVVEPDGRVHTEPGKVEAILAASFNPPHAGHLALAAVAARRLGRRVDFELSLVNADKTPVCPGEARARIQGLAWRGRTLATRAPTFVEKARLFPGCVFAVGFDTASRVVEDRFYGGRDGRIRALDEIRRRGSRFLMAGRVGGDGAFLGLGRLTIPEGVEDLFEEIPEADFREDVSSTEIRACRRTGV